MKVIILAGGLGSRLSEETTLKPKPMVELGGKPILLHIMEIYSHFGHNEFLICCGYKGDVIKDYFNNLKLYSSDVTFDYANGAITHHGGIAKPWKAKLVNTGLTSQTGGRLKRVRDFLDEDEDFLATYGDGVGNVNINKLIKFHQENNMLATCTTVLPPGRFGVVLTDGDFVIEFDEKTNISDRRISCGFFVFNYKMLDLISGDQTVLETDVLPKLAVKKQLMAFKHSGFWHPMDTIRDKNVLDEYAKEKTPPWFDWH